MTTVVESELLNGKLPEGSHIIYVKTPVQLVQVIVDGVGSGTVFVSLEPA